MPMSETALRAYLDRLDQVRTRFEVHQQDIREMLISLDGVFEALCRELQEVRGPLRGPEGPNQWAEASPLVAPQPEVETPQPSNPDGFGSLLYKSVVPAGYRLALVKDDG